MPEKRNEAPCGCWRAVIERMVPKFTEGTVDEGGGRPILDEAGGIVMESREEIEDGFCEVHSQKLAERQIEVQKALASGMDPEKAMLLMAGVHPLILTEDGEAFKP